MVFRAFFYGRTVVFRVLLRKGPQGVTNGRGSPFLSYYGVMCIFRVLVTGNGRLFVGESCEDYCVFLCGGSSIVAIFYGGSVLFPGQAGHFVHFVRVPVFRVLVRV